MGVQFANNASSTLAATITAVQTTITVQAGDAAEYPTPGAGDWFPVTVTDGIANMEIMRCTARAGAVLTVTRAQEGTTGKAFNAGGQVDLRLTKAALDELASAAILLSKLLTVDGAGSGLDADLLDGQHGAYYLDWANFTSKPATFPPSAHGHPESDITNLVPDLAAKVAKVGDTMTGALTLAHPTASNSLILNKVAGNNWNLIESQVATKRRWLLEFGNNVAETGGNAGTNIALDRYDDAGVAIDQPWTINRANGVVGMPLGLTTLTQPPGTNNTSGATTAFVTAANTSTPVVPKLTAVDAAVDWDTLLTPGWYNGVLGTTNAHHPVPGKYFYCLVLTYTGTTNFTQVAIPFGQAADIAAGIWMRGRTGGVWTAWVSSPVGAVVKNVKETLIVASGTFTPDPNCIYADVDAWGGGGAGGGHAVTTTTTSFGGGGAGGAKASGTFTKAELGASVACTIGAGGAGVVGTTGGTGTATTFGALLSAAGGPGGTTATMGTAGFSYSMPMPAKVQSATGDVRGWTVGGGGGLGSRDTAGTAGWLTVSGNGGETEWGGGGIGTTITGVSGGGGTAGAANTGSGGSGGAAGNNNAAGRAGAAGGSGVIRVREYLSV